MEVQNILGSNLLFLVKCRDEKEAAKLIKRAKSVYVDLGSCFISKAGYHIPPPPPPVVRPETVGEAIERHAKPPRLGREDLYDAALEFIMRVLSSDATREEYESLPTVIDFWLELDAQGKGTP